MPRVGTRSLWATGRPNSGPAASPRASAASFARASSSARSAVSVTIAFTFGLTRSIWVRCAWTTSVTETSRARMRRASSAAVRKQTSVLTGALHFARALQIRSDGQLAELAALNTLGKEQHLETLDPTRTRVDSCHDVVPELLRFLFRIRRPARDVQNAGLPVVSKRQLRCHSISPAARRRPT